MTDAVQIPLRLDERPPQRFETFWHGPNHATVQALQQLAVGHWVVVTGPDGSGKSHLLLATASRHRGQYLSLPRLLEQGPDTLMAFHDAPCACLDDIAACFGRREQEVGLFNALNAWRANGSTLIMALTETASNEDIILPDLRSRLQWGTTLRLKSLDDDDRFELARHHAGNRNIALADDVIRVLLTRGPRRIGKLLGFIDRMAEESLSRKRRITTRLVHQLLGADNAAPSSTIEDDVA